MIVDTLRFLAVSCVLVGSTMSHAFRTVVQGVVNKVSCKFCRYFGNGSENLSAYVYLNETA